MTAPAARSPSATPSVSQHAGGVTPPAGSGQSPKRDLLKVLGVLFGATMIVSGTIGAGILRTPGDVAATLPSPAWFLGVWIAGGVYALCGAMTMAELAAMLPKSGGQYVFARRAMGEYAGFVVGWSDWFSSTASAGAAAIALGELTALLWPSMSGSTTLVAVAVTVLFTMVHWVGVRTGDVTTQIWGVVKVIALLGVAVACIFAPAAAPPEVVSQLAMPSGLALATALLLAFQAVLYTYDGWTSYVYFGGEVADPRKVPRAMAMGVLSVAAVYLALNWAFLHVLGIHGLAGEKFAAKAAAVAVFGTAGDRVVSGVMLVSLLGMVSAILMMSSRVPFALAQDGLLPRTVAHVNKGGTPDYALLGTAALSLLLIVTGTFASVLALAAFFFVLQYGVSFASLFILRRKEPDLPRPYRAIGYPVIPAIVMLGATAFIVGSFFGDRANAIRSLMVLAASWPLYWGVLALRKRSA